MQSSARRNLVVLSLAALLLAPADGRAQLPIRRDEQPDLTVDAAAREEAIENVLKALDEAYVFPDKAKEMAADIRKRLEDKEYDEVTCGKQFAKTLTEHLRAISKDKHLHVDFSAEPLPERPEGEERGPSPEEFERMRRFMARRNFGFERVERLRGNVGYLDLRGFGDPSACGETAAAAMSFLANADALIVDVRKNGGGDPAMVALITSYLFGPEPVHLNDLYFRPEDSTRQWWTLPYVPGKRFGPDKPVYVLTSGRTFSAAEEFTYNLKNLKRATIVGETTGGGAHPGGFRRLGEHFGAFIPSGRAINPISKTNWEGTGVTPDIPVSEAEALAAAHIAAVEALIKAEEGKARDEEPMLIEELKKVLDDLKAQAKGADATKQARGS